MRLFETMPLGCDTPRDFLHAPQTAGGIANALHIAEPEGSAVGNSIPCCREAEALKPRVRLSTGPLGQTEPVIGRDETVELEHIRHVDGKVRNPVLPTAIA